MARRDKKQKQQPNDSWLVTDVQEIPRADIDKRDKTVRRARTYRVLIYSIMFGLFPLSMLANLAMVPKILDAPETAVTNVAAVDPATKSVAMLAVKDWLAQKPSPVPGGQLLSWDAMDVQQQPAITVNPDNGQASEVSGLQLHRLTVAAGNGLTFDTTVQVATAISAGNKVIGDPTLIPRAPSDATAMTSISSWPGLNTLTPSEETEQAVGAWVQAFTSGDPDALRLAVGDTTGSRAYVPLVKAKATDVVVSEAAAPPNADGTAQDAPASVVARVSFALTWEGTKLAQGETAPTVAYDVLIEKANTAAPVVVAWGGAGTGESLVPYANGVEGRKITASTVTTPVQPAEAAGTNK